MILVFGSINLDVIFALPALPRPGETALGPGYRTAAGGKGANQAVAAARDGAAVAMIGCVGDDAFAAPALAGLAAAAVDLGDVVRVDAPTGCAAVCVDPQGANLIAVGAGANLELAASQVPDSMLERAGTLVLQMEVPAAENAALIARAAARGCRTLLNLAPAGAIDRAALGRIDWLIVNESEAAAVLGEPMGDPIAAADRLVRSARGVVLTLGAAGAVAATAEACWQVAALPVVPVDTTGAGDCFVGVFAAALDRGAALPLALARASVAAGLACLAPGAQPSLPDSRAIDARLSELVPWRVR